MVERLEQLPFDVEAFDEGLVVAPGIFHLLAGVQDPLFQRLSFFFNAQYENLRVFCHLKLFTYPFEFMDIMNTIYFKNRWRLKLRIYITFNLTF